jgi:hypothetical protein
MTETTLAPTSTVHRRELLQSNQIAGRLLELFVKRKMTPAFTGFYLFQSLGLTFLVAVLDSTQIGDHSRYIDKDFLRQLSADLAGLPIYLSNSTGIRYVILLSSRPKLPRKISLPLDTPHGRLLIGASFNHETVSVSWEETPHIAVLGATGSGKSIFLQSLVIQAIRDGMQLMLCDIDQTTFGAFENHPALLAPIASTPQAALELIEKSIAECDRRAELFTKMPEHPQKISEYNAVAVRHGTEPLPRVLVVLDEASAVLTAMGGGKGALAQTLAMLGWRGRKFGVHFVFAAQEFTQEILGGVRNQVALTVCFRVRSAQMAERMHCGGAERISASRPGLAITDRFGPLQTFFVEPASFQRPALLPSISDQEGELFARSIRETDGRLSIPILSGWGVRERAARSLLETWEQRGWVLRDPQRDNARYITPKLREILPNRQTGQAASNPA